MVARTGLDFVFLDSEHIVLDRTELSWMCQAYAGLGLAPIVRIPSSQMIDGGAAGVIAPYVETAAQVRDLRGAVKLRPLKGERLSRVLSGEERLNFDEKKYLSNYNQNNVCIVNIESIPALNALEDILNRTTFQLTWVFQNSMIIHGLKRRYKG
jgi:4-hydroxy-2-oxoheptanedioate aldolase